MICLDANAVIAAIGARPPLVRERLERELADGAVIVVPSIVLYELEYGIAKNARREANATALRTFLTLDIAPLPFDEEDAREANDVRAALERAGTPIDLYDILIAAQARRRGATLATANVGEFARVPGLVVENWGA
jgi:tRNA(fMet)-specific endonuclease VapC